MSCPELPHSPRGVRPTPIRHPLKDIAYLRVLRQGQMVAPMLGGQLRDLRERRRPCPLLSSPQNCCSTVFANPFPVASVLCSAHSTACLGAGGWGDGRLGTCSASSWDLTGLRSIFAALPSSSSQLRGAVPRHDLLEPDYGRGKVPCPHTGLRTLALLVTFMTLLMITPQKPGDCRG